MQVLIFNSLNVIFLRKKSEFKVIYILTIIYLFYKMVNINNNIKNYVLKIATIFLAFFIIPVFSNAALVLDSIQFDPAIIASGDEVEVVVQFHDQITAITSDKIGNKNYEFQVKLLADDSVSKEYVLILDREGEDIFGKVYAGEVYNKKFRIKVAQNAPAANYEFKLVGQWYKNDVPEGGTQEIKFLLPVKKEGISLSLSNIISNPEKIRSGDKNVLISASIFNSGEKLAKNVILKFNYPQKITSSYTNNNEILTGVIASFEEKKIQIYVDTEKELKSGVYEINYTLSYQDIDSNEYTKNGVIAVVIKKKPSIEVISSNVIGKAGEEIILEVVLKNIGEEKAESVDVRIVKQSSQPFEMDVRSAYIGQLNPDENGTAIFLIRANSDAEIKRHNLNLAIRAKGDSEEGDSNIYTFSDSASIEITNKSENNYPLYGFVFLIIIVLAGVIVYALKEVKRK